MKYLSADSLVQVASSGFRPAVASNFNGNTSSTHSTPGRSASTTNSVDRSKGNAVQKPKLSINSGAVDLTGGGRLPAPREVIEIDLTPPRPVHRAAAAVSGNSNSNSNSKRSLLDVVDCVTPELPRKKSPRASEVGLDSLHLLPSDVLDLSRASISSSGASSCASFKSCRSRCSDSGGKSLFELATSSSGASRLVASQSSPQLSAGSTSGTLHTTSAPQVRVVSAEKDVKVGVLISRESIAAAKLKLAGSAAPPAVTTVIDLVSSSSDGDSSRDKTPSPPDMVVSPQPAVVAVAPKAVPRVVAVPAAAAAVKSESGVSPSSSSRNAASTAAASRPKTLVSAATAAAPSPAIKSEANTAGTALPRPATAAAAAVPKKEKATAAATPLDRLRDMRAILAEIDSFCSSVLVTAPDSPLLRRGDSAGCDLGALSLAGAQKSTSSSATAPLREVQQLHKLLWPKTAAHHKDAPPGDAAEERREQAEFGPDAMLPALIEGLVG